MPDDQVSPSTFLLGELRRARSAAGLSQEDLGKTINYSASLVSAVENGQLSHIFISTSFRPR